MYEHSNGGTVALVRREEFSGRELMQTGGETASTAVAAHAKAQVESRFVMALRRPRDMDDVRVRILKECKRPGFAESAWYKKPVGKGVEGFSIRFAEAAARCMGNVLCETTTVYDDHEKRIVRVSVTDLESNTTYPRDVTINKTVERSHVKEGQEVIGSRQNSQGKTTYLVGATEDDLLNKEGSLVSKALRNLIMRILPGDIQDEAETLIRKTRQERSAADPDAERKKISDAFAGIGVMPADLKSYIGQELASLSPAQLDDLRKLYTAIKDGETSWKEVIAEKTAAAEGADEPKDQAPKSGKEAIKDRLKSKAAQPSKALDYLDPAHKTGLNLINQGTQEGWLSDGAAGGLTDQLNEQRRNSDLKGIQDTVRKLEALRDAPPQREPGEE